MRKDNSKEISDYEMIKQILNNADSTALYHVEIVFFSKEGGEDEK
jgi:hypothetical protein